MNGDLDRGLIGEDRKSFCVRRSECSGDPSEAQILNDLEFVDQEFFWVIWVEP